jgi:hypothetical protein
VDGEDVPVGKVGFGELAKTRFLNINRTKAEVASEIVSIINAKEGTEYEKVYDAVGEDPSRLDSIFEDERFKHLRTIVWSAPLSENAKLFDSIQLGAVKVDEINSVEVKNYPMDQSHVLDMIEP